MLLSPEEAELFFKLHCALMQFVKEQLQLVDVPGSAVPYAAFPGEKRHQVVQAFVGRLDLLDAFIAANPARLSREELDIVSSWRHLVSGRFIALRQLKKHMILLTGNGTPSAYGVTGLVDPMERVIGRPLPAMIETVLLPFRGKIIYDGIVSGFNVTFGPGSRRRFEQDFREAKPLGEYPDDLETDGSERVHHRHPPTICDDAARGVQTGLDTVRPGRSRSRGRARADFIIDLSPLNIITTSAIAGCMRCSLKVPRRRNLGWPIFNAWKENAPARPRTSAELEDTQNISKR